MILRNGSYLQLMEKIKKDDRKVIIYGAGMIGQIIVPELVQKYGIAEYIECFIDADPRKEGQKIRIDGYSCEVRNLEYLYQKRKNYILLITNSNFFPVIDFLDNIEELDDIESYIIPMMQIYELQSMKSVEVVALSEKPVIPKKINYCWFGKRELPDLLKRCMDSWAEQCPDFEIVCWNENNFDVNKYIFTKQAYEREKYSFVTDLARLDILYENGGIYLDTDVTIIRNLELLLHQSGFVGVEKWGNVNTGGGCGFVPRHPMLKEMIAYRNQFSFVLNDGSLNMETNGVYETIPFLWHGFRPDHSLQQINNVTVYPPYVFHPYDYMSCGMQKKEATYGIHHFFGGWLEEEERLNRKNTQNAYHAVLKRIDDGGKKA